MLVLIIMLIVVSWKKNNLSGINKLFLCQQQKSNLKILNLFVLILFVKGGVGFLAERAAEFFA